MAKFTTYDCKLRLEGSVLNEVPKTGITAAEVEMYRALHGDDAIVGLQEAGEIKSTDREERERIKTKFINPNRDAPPRLKAKTEMFRNLFGHDSLPMPKALEAPAEEADADEVETVEVAPRRTRAQRQEAPAAALE